MIYCKEALAAVSKVTKVTEKAILSPGREWPAFRARMIVAILMDDDGNTHEDIAMVIRRCPAAARLTLLRGLEYLRYSKVFSDLFDKAKKEYEKQKSLRVS